MKKGIKIVSIVRRTNCYTSSLSYKNVPTYYFKNYKVSIYLNIMGIKLRYKSYWMINTYYGFRYSKKFDCTNRFLFMKLY